MEGFTENIGFWVCITLFSNTEYLHTDKYEDMNIQKGKLTLVFFPLLLKRMKILRAA